MNTTQRLSEETDQQWLGYCCYRDLGILRTLKVAFGSYRGVSGRSEASRGVLKITGSFSRWKRDFNWDDRTREWDLEEETRQREIQRTIDDDAYQVELDEFRRLQLSAGKTGTAIALNLKTKLLKWVETHPTMTTWTEALTVARIVTALEMSSAEQWAKALHIDRLLEQMDEADV